MKFKMKTVQLILILLAAFIAVVFLLQRSDFQQLTLLQGNKNTTETADNGTDSVYNVSFKNRQFLLRVLLDPIRGCKTVTASLPVAIFVLSAPQEFEQRRTIRETWAKDQNSGTTVFLHFMMGFNHENKTVQLAALMEEHREYDDLLVADYHDTYVDLSIKIFLMLAWADERCRGIPFLLKTDSDTLISLDGLTLFIDDLKRKSKSYTENTLFCRMGPKHEPDRSPTSKWHVSMEAYPETFFPNYCLGPTYLASMDAVPKLLRATYGKYYFVDDVFITGMLADEVGIRRLYLGNFYIGPNDSFCVFFIGVHSCSNPNALRIAWNKNVLARNSNDKECREKRKEIV